MLMILAHSQHWKSIVKDTVLMSCIVAIIVLPWTYRNYQISHSFVLVSTGMGEVLTGAYNNTVFKGGLSISGTWQPTSGSLPHDARNYTPADDAADTTRALNWIRTHLSALPPLLGLHFINMWIPYTYSHGLAFEESPGSFLYYFTIFLIYALATPVMLAAFAGLFLTWKHYKQQLLPVYLLLALVIVQNVAFYGDMRFRSPIEPVLILLASGSLACLVRKRYNAADTSAKQLERVFKNGHVS
jgi:hypothetical protein